MRLSVLAALALVAGCAAPAPAAPPAGRCADHAEALRALVGQPEAEVRPALAAMPGIRTIRLLAPNQPMTRDLRPDRVTGTVRDGVVESLGCI